MIRVLLLICLALPVRAEIIPPAGREDARVRTMPYAANDVVKLVGFAGYSIDIQFADDEFPRPDQIGTGDMESIEIAAVRNFLFIKPLVAKAHTNLTVITNKRHYRFEYQSRPVVDKDAIYSLRFTYPDDEAAIASRKAQVANVRALAIARPRNADYWWCGSADIRPSRAYDDGVLTYITFPEMAEFPALFTKNADGISSLVNFHVSPEDKNTIVIHRTAKEFVARKGSLVGCIRQGKDGNSHQIMNDNNFSEQTP